MAKKLSQEVRVQRDQIRFYEDYKKSDNFADILKAKVSENFATCRKKMDVLYNVGSPEDQERDQKEVRQPHGKTGERS